MQKFWCKLIVVTLLLGWGLELPGETRFGSASARDRATWQLAVHTAARRALEAAAGLQSPGTARVTLIQDALTREMLEATGKHARRAESHRQGRGLVRRLLREAYAERFDAILAEAAAQAPLPVAPADVNAILGDRLETTLATALKGFETTQYERLFTKVRDDATARARQAMDRRATAPPFDALDRLFSELADGGVLPPEPWPAKLAKPFSRQLHDYAGAAGGPQLEEVASYAEGVAGRLAGALRRQHQQQRDTADALLQDETVAASPLAEAIERETLARLEEAVRNIEATDSETAITLPVYPLFSGIRQRVASRAAELEARRFAAFIRQTPLMNIAPDVLRGMIEADLAAHAMARESHQLLENHLRAERGPAVVSTYATVTAIPAEAQSRFRELLEKPGSPAATAFAHRLSEALDRELLPLRAALAEAQYAERFGSLNGLERLPDPLLYHVLDRGGELPATPAAAIDFLLSTGLTDPEATSPPLMEEAGQRLQARTAGLLEEAHQALTAQLALLRELEKQRMPSLREDVQAGRAFEDIHRDWLQAYQARWEATVTGDNPYGGLTAPAREALDKTLRQLYDAPEETPLDVTETPAAAAPPVEAPAEVLDPEAPRPDTAEPPPVDPDLEDPVAGLEVENPPVPDETVEPPPESSEQEAAPAEGGGEMAAAIEELGLADRPLPDVLLTLSGTNAATCQAHLIVGGELAEAQSWTFDATDAETAADALFASIAPLLDRLQAGAVARAADKRGFLGWRWRAGSPALSFYLVVESNAVRHRTSLLLRRRVEAGMGQVEGGPIELDWQAGLTY